MLGDEFIRAMAGIKINLESLNVEVRVLELGINQLQSLKEEWLDIGGNEEDPTYEMLTNSIRRKESQRGLNLALKETFVELINSGGEDLTEEEFEARVSKAYLKVKED